MFKHTLAAVLLPFLSVLVFVYGCWVAMKLLWDDCFSVYLFQSWGEYVDSLSEIFEKVRP